MGYLDFNLDLPPGESFAPDPARVRALARLLPATPTGFAPPVTDRSAWSRWRSHPVGKRIIADARAAAAAPFPDLTDERWLECLEQRDVTHINTVHPAVRRRQVVLLLAEAIEDRGEFLAPIAETVERLAALRSWVHPNNDLPRRTYDGLTMEVDLTAAHFAANLAQTGFILGPRLAAATRETIATELDRRFFTPLRRRIETGRDIYWWTAVKHNWNAVCLECYVSAALVALPDAADRAWWIALADSLLHNSRDGFADDGFCGEGVGYWSYGFGHFTLLAEWLRLATGGVLDPLDDPKMRRVARFADRVEVLDDIFPTYADCGRDTRPAPWLRAWPANRPGTDPAHEEPAEEFDPFAGMALQMADEPMLWMFQTRDPWHPRRRRGGLALRDWFDAAGFLICRPGPATGRRFAATLLGGNNGVNHNHNDLGTFTVLLDGRPVLADPGAEVYSFRTFSAQRYESPLLNSLGHPVPRVDGRLQQPGAERRAVVVEHAFTPEQDRMVLDLRSAYDVAGLRRLHRTFLYSREGDGALTITDEVEMASPGRFESALITFGELQMMGAGRLRLTDGAAAVDVAIFSEGGGVEVEPAVIEQEPHPLRVALRFAAPVTTARLRVRITPA